VQRPSAVAAEEAGHRGAVGGDRERAREDSKHVPHVAFGGGDAITAQRRAGWARYRWPTVLMQDAVPALGEFPASFRGGDLRGADGQEPADSCPASAASWQSRDGACMRASKRSHGLAS